MNEVETVYFQSKYPFSGHTHFCTAHQLFMDMVEFNGCDKGQCKDCTYRLRKVKHLISEPIND